jgi:hypothetical protein
MTQTGLRDRPHHLSAVRRPLDPPRGHRRARRDGQDSRAPGLAHPRSTKDSGSPRRVHADSLIPPPQDSGSVPEPSRSLCPFPPPAHPNGSQCLARSWENVPDSFPRRMNSRISGGGIYKLTPHWVLWYFAERPFKFLFPEGDRVKLGQTLFNKEE